MLVIHVVNGSGVVVMDTSHFHKVENVSEKLGTQIH